MSYNDDNVIKLPFTHVNTSGLTRGRNAQVAMEEMTAATE
jgi:hypothetical protein